MKENHPKVLKRAELLGQQFSVYGTPEEPLFMAKDVAAWIEHTDVSKMVLSVDEDEKLTRTIFVSGQNREVWLLTEAGLYEILMQSRKPIAKQFKKGVKKILHDIRTTGMYISRTATVAEKMKAASWAARFLNLSDSARLLLAKQILDPLGLPTPDYVPSKGVLRSATELLKECGSTLSIHQFNKKMVSLGLLADMTRAGSGGAARRFKCITEQGAAWGENQVNPKAPGRTQPAYYADKFAALLKLVEEKEAAV